MERLKHPLNARQVEAADSMFEELFKRTKQLSNKVTTLIDNSSSVSAAVTGPWTAFTQNLGVAHQSGSFVLSGLSGLTLGKIVFVQQVSTPIATKGNATDEPEMDMVFASGIVTSPSQIHISWWSSQVVVGDINFTYAVGV